MININISCRDVLNLVRSHVEYPSIRLIEVTVHGTVDDAVSDGVGEAQRTGNHPKLTNGRRRIFFVLHDNRQSGDNERKPETDECRHHDDHHLRSAALRGAGLRLGRSIDVVSSFRSDDGGCACRRWVNLVDVLLHLMSMLARNQENLGVENDEEDSDDDVEDDPDDDDLRNDARRDARSAVVDESEVLRRRRRDRQNPGTCDQPGDPRPRQDRVVAQRVDDGYEAVHGDEHDVEESGVDRNSFDGRHDRLVDGDAAGCLAEDLVDDVVEHYQREKNVGGGQTGQDGVRLRLELGCCSNSDHREKVGEENDNGSQREYDISEDQLRTPDGREIGCWTDDRLIRFDEMRRRRLICYGRRVGKEFDVVAGIGHFKRSRRCACSNVIQLAVTCYRVCSFSTDCECGTFECFQLLKFTSQSYLWLFTILANNHRHG